MYLRTKQKIGTPEAAKKIFSKYQEGAISPRHAVILLGRKAAAETGKKTHKIYGELEQRLFDDMVNAAVSERDPAVFNDVIELAGKYSDTLQNPDYALDAVKKIVLQADVNSKVGVAAIRQVVFRKPGNEEWCEDLLKMAAFRRSGKVAEAAMKGLVGEKVDREALGRVLELSENKCNQKDKIGIDDLKLEFLSSVAAKCIGKMMDYDVLERRGGYEIEQDRELLGQVIESDLFKGNDDKENLIHDFNTAVLYINKIRSLDLMRRVQKTDMNNFAQKVAGGLKPSNPNF